MSIDAEREKCTNRKKYDISFFYPLNPREISVFRVGSRLGHCRSGQRHEPVREGGTVAERPSLDKPVYVTGVAESLLGKVADHTELSMMAMAAREALAESGLKLSDVDGLFVRYRSTEPF